MECSSVNEVDNAASTSKGNYEMAWRNRNQGKLPVAIVFFQFYVLQKQEGMEAKYIAVFQGAAMTRVPIKLWDCRFIDFHWTNN